MLNSVNVSSKSMEGQLSSLRWLKRHRVGCESLVNLSKKLISTHSPWTDLVVEVNRNLCTPGPSGCKKMVNKGLKPNVAVGRKREREVGRVLMQIGLGLDPMLIHFDDPDHLIVSSVVRHIVIQGDARLQYSRRTADKKGSADSWPSAPQVQDRAHLRRASLDAIGSG